MLDCMKVELRGVNPLARSVSGFEEVLVFLV
jgi:hypothetical protein